ncbi:D-alanine--poly(phosphoribitol) ligase subunit DltA [Clostridium aciditolerans]|uniref:D-alanine--poly(Phosphoribitol) ligase subunit DltA n=1 Tax=Clostridium aciditolerans TaxID=339861 RepID=A0A934HSS8_9CLOT|nr:D-alanine--poly(phosphoribitol) ligase subunit DltA [Clostridium aciditolerans]MBI6873665.1 D-alanine--poly(phosphoribitol) ligase subunit DltA [Clostridium aciditolerans]
MNVYDLMDKYSKTNLILRKYRNSSMKYEELIRKSDALASYIIKRFDNNKMPIVVCGHKEHLMLVCFLSCTKSGHAYIPVDSSMSKERIKYIVENSNSKLIFNISDNKLHLDNIDIKNCAEIETIINSHATMIPDKIYRVQDEDIHYIICTSGSTGKPKGVKTTSNCLKSFVNWALTLWDYSEGTHYVFMNQAPFSFDLSVMDLYLSLYTGSTLFSIDNQMISNMKELFSYLKSSDINIWVSTPSFAEMCLTDINFNNNLLPRLKVMLFCGEVLTNNCVQKLQNRFKYISIINLYGPTEATVAVTAIKIDTELSSNVNPLPVGYIKNDCKLFIVEKNNSVLNNDEDCLEFNGVSYRILPEGEKGEIIISGKSVSPGYFNNNEISKNVFSKRIINGIENRYYKTEDEGYIKDNLLYYCGRIDSQIKLDGLRIELENIANSLREIEFIENAVVLPVKKENKLQYLAAVVTLNKVLLKKDFEVGLVIKEKLKNLLSNYMIPRKIIIKEHLPMTINGKINRRLLTEELK